MKDSLPDFDRRHIWHPYTSLKDPLPCVEISSAQGEYLYTAPGQQLIDGMSSWWCVIHGYNHPLLNAAAEAQLKKMSHVMFGGITHKAAHDLARKLLDMTPENIQCVFFADSGSVSVEVAIKAAIQYQYNRGKSAKHKLLAFRGAYHGDTFGAMNVCDPVTGMHHLFSGVLNENFFAPRPSCRFGEDFDAASLEPVREILHHHADEIAALIIEPVVQGAGGMWFYSPAYLDNLRALCDEYDVLLIFDEIATGFGRTGKMFAVDHCNITPDIMCVGKALTGGYLTLAAVLCSRKVAEGVGTLMHGPTFMGNALACAVANASLDLLAGGEWRTQLASIETQLNKELAPCAGHDLVADVRVLGAIGVVETKKDVNMAAIQQFFIKRGVWIRPFGKLIYLMPPYMISPENLSHLTSAVRAALDCADNFN